MYTCEMKLNGSGGGAFFLMADKPPAAQAFASTRIPLVRPSSAATALGLRHSVPSELREIKPLRAGKEAAKGAVPADQVLQLRAPRSLTATSSEARLTGSASSHRPAQPESAPIRRSATHSTLPCATSGASSVSGGVAAQLPAPLPRAPPYLQRQPSHRAPPAPPSAAAAPRGAAWQAPRAVRIGFAAPGRLSDLALRNVNRAQEEHRSFAKRQHERGTMYARQVTLHLANSALGRAIGQRERYVAWATVLLNNVLPELLAAAAVEGQPCMCVCMDGWM